MAFRNQDYLYNHLPAVYRANDGDGKLYRFLQAPCDELDRLDFIYYGFYQRIQPNSAPDEWVTWWLWALFGWSWYPAWFTLQRKQQLYANFARHLARRGTAVGIEKWLAEFSVIARVWARNEYWGEAVYGENGWTVDPLGFVVQVECLKEEVNGPDIQVWGEQVWGEGILRDTQPTLTYREIEDLVRYEWPSGQSVYVDYYTPPNVNGAA